MLGKTRRNDDFSWNLSLLIPYPRSPCTHVPHFAYCGYSVIPLRMNDVHTQLAQVFPPPSSVLIHPLLRHSALLLSHFTTTRKGLGLVVGVLNYRFYYYSGMMANDQDMRGTGERVCYSFQEEHTKPPGQPGAGNGE